MNATATKTANPAANQNAALRRRSHSSRRWARARRRSSSSIRRNSAGGRGIREPFRHPIMPGVLASVNCCHGRVL
jgi:hypothetical protein